jgi:hypothetical protein
MKCSRTVQLRTSNFWARVRSADPQGTALGSTQLVSRKYITSQVFEKIWRQILNFGVGPKISGPE